MEARNHSLFEALGNAKGSGDTEAQTAIRKLVFNNKDVARYPLSGLDSYGNVIAETVHNSSQIDVPLGTIIEVENMMASLNLPFTGIHNLVESLGKGLSKHGVRAANVYVPERDDQVFASIILDEP